MNNIRMFCLKNVNVGRTLSALLATGFEETRAEERINPLPTSLAWASVVNDGEEQEEVINDRKHTYALASYVSPSRANYHIVYITIIVVIILSTKIRIQSRIAFRAFTNTLPAGSLVAARFVAVF